MNYWNSVTALGTMLAVCSSGCASSTFADAGDVRQVPDGHVVDAGVPVTYTESMIPTQCEDLSTIGTHIERYYPDRQLFSNTVEMPFAFTFFRRDILYYSVSTSGFAQLHDARFFGPDGAPTNRPLGDQERETGREGRLAIFWDDLIQAPETGDFRVAILGSGATRVLVLDWRSYIFYAAPQDSRLSFQIKLFETTNVIEYHYCELIGPDPNLVSGGSATVGIQYGATGFQHSYNTPGSVNTMNAIRWTPDP